MEEELSDPEGYRDLGKIAELINPRTIDPVEARIGQSIKDLSSNRCRCGGKGYKSWQYPDGIGMICIKCLRRAMARTVKRITPKIGRNETCPCGSGKKYKRCCGNDL